MFEIYIDADNQFQFNFYKDFIKLKDDIKTFREKGEKHTLLFLICRQNEHQASRVKNAIIESAKVNYRLR